MFFKVPNLPDDQLVEFFKSVEEKREELGITDFSVGLTTLEEVFLELSKRDQFIADVDDADATQLAAKADKVAKLQLEVPEGAEVGSVLSIPHPQGSSRTPLSYTIQKDDKPGAMVTLEYIESAPKKRASMKFQIPEGAAPGMTIAMDRPDTDEKVQNSVFFSFFLILPCDIEIYFYKILHQNIYFFSSFFFFFLLFSSFFFFLSLFQHII